MVFNVLITSKEMIKPSSPTPNHLKTFNLSFLDQIAPPIFIPLVFFYQANHHQFPDSQTLLKQSLSDVLTQFYPLAGRLSSDILTVNCDDSGALYVEAKAHADLLEIITKASMDDIKQFLPLGPNITTEMSSGEPNSSIILAVQINMFDSGGVAISVQMSHHIGDGASIVNFMNAWAATCRGDDDGKLNFSAMFDFHNVFPHKDLSKESFKPFAGAMSKQKIVTKRLVFDKEKLAKLEMELMSSQGGVKTINPTRVEVVTAFLWRQFVDIAKGKNSKKTVTTWHVVNLRLRVDPVLHNRSFGNVYIVSPIARPPVLADHDRLNLVDNLSKAMRKVDAEYMKKMKSGDEYLNYLKEVVGQLLKGEIELCPFTSWCRFPVYEVDYGWGKPIWACPCTMPYKNTVILMSTSSGEGIEAWVNILEEDEMKISH
ncbi:OLC1v1008077C1 [Oldenlandia corymbosa var. corymbosa]|uniref:OLC1v1008077C1 n=1 Tax=Oldenlandia corymbosa var. corymbosa TaxID=529605 RepID=A0AAV1DNK9_OLDCO|nr:OLC1v1008077C1 [Oldenlandia corymbosa var. corymbosa]